MFAALTLSLQVSCQKEDASADISGEWHLDNSGLAYDADVYVVFSEGSFRLYQKVGDQSRPWLYEGTYSVSDNVLTGRYSDGTRLGGASGQGYRVGIERGAATEDELATFYDDPVEPGYLSFSGIVSTETLLGYVPEDYPDEMAITGGPYVIATFSNSNGTVTVTPNTIPLASGNSVTLESMGYFYYITGGQYEGYYNYYAMPKPYFPMTMTRIEDSASASAKAVPAGQVTASARKGKVAKAGYRTLSPLKTVYKVR